MRNVGRVSSSSRVAAFVRLAAVVVAEAGAVVLLHWLGSVAYLQVGWADPVAWAQRTAAEDVLLAAVRAGALATAYWLLGSTVLYVLARATRVPAAVRAVQWAALPTVRRLADRVVAVTLSGSSLLGGGVAAAQEPPVPLPPAPVLAELDPAVYEPTPAGDDSGGEAWPRMEVPLPAPPLPAPAGPGPADEIPASVTPPDDPTPSPLESTAAVDSRREAVPVAAPPRSERSDRTAPQPLAAAGGVTSPEAAPAVHVVTDGEHLWGIAAATLQRDWGRVPSTSEVGGYWRQLVEANRDRLRSSDPDLVHPGEQLTLPPTPTAPTAT